MMLYGTITSERASKGQGGNKRLDIEIKIGDRDKAKFFLSVVTFKDGKGYRLELVDVRNRSTDKVLAFVQDEIEETKGNKQKGEVCTHENCDDEGNCHACDVNVFKDK